MKLARTIFILRLRAEGADPIRSLRQALKRLLRDYGLRCISLHADAQRERDPVKGYAQ
jgi:hypothetical protein